MGKLTDGFLDLLRLNDDDDDFDDIDGDYDETEEIEEIRFPKKKPLKSTRVREKDEEDDDLSLSEPAKPARMKSQRNTNVVPMKSRNGMEVCVIKPTSVDDAKDITDTLIKERAVILNLEGLHVELAQRIFDFASGSCYALDGNFQKVSNYIFIVTPSSVEISGDLPELLDGTLDGSSDLI